MEKIQQTEVPKRTTKEDGADDIIESALQSLKEAETLKRELMELSKEVAKILMKTTSPRLQQTETTQAEFLSRDLLSIPTQSDEEETRGKKPFVVLLSPLTRQIGLTGLCCICFGDKKRLYGEFSKPSYLLTTDVRRSSCSYRAVCRVIGSHYPVHTCGMSQSLSRHNFSKRRWPDSWQLSCRLVPDCFNRSRCLRWCPVQLIPRNVWMALLWFILFFSSRKSIVLNVVIVLSFHTKKKKILTH